MMESHNLEIYLMHNDVTRLDARESEEGGSSSQHSLQLINIHNHDFSQC